MILIGDSGVGKSNLISRFTKNEFAESHQATIGVDFSNRNVNVNNKIIKAQIWDTAGQDRFKSISQAFYRGSVAALVVFDLTSQKSFESLATWMSEIERYADKDIVLMLVGNKSDLARRRVVDFGKAIEFARLYDMDYIETSALDTTNVEAVFLKIIRDVYMFNSDKKEVASAAGLAEGNISLGVDGSGGVSSNRDEENGNCCRN